MGDAPPKVLTPNRARIYALINVCATPGLGSIMGRRFISGSAQLALAVSGFCLLMWWMITAFYVITVESIGDTPPEFSNDWAAKVGLRLFIAGWLWSVVTSVSLIRQARTGNNNSYV